MIGLLALVEQVPSVLGAVPPRRSARRDDRPSAEYPSGVRGAGVPAARLCEAAGVEGRPEAAVSRAGLGWVCVVLDATSEGSWTATQQASIITGRQDLSITTIPPHRAGWRVVIAGGLSRVCKVSHGMSCR